MALQNRLPDILHEVSMSTRRTGACLQNRKDVFIILNIGDPDTNDARQGIHHNLIVEGMRLILHTSTANKCTPLQASTALQAYCSANIADTTCLLLHRNSKQQKVSF